MLSTTDLSAVAGYARLASSFTNQQNQLPGNAQCLNMLIQRGPYNGAGPDSRIFFGDAARWNDGFGAVGGNKVFVNGLKQQAAMETLHAVGVSNPYATMAKNNFTGANPTVSVGQPGTALATSVFNAMPYDKQFPNAGAVSAAATNVPALTSDLGQTYFTFNNGISLVGAPTVGGATLADIGGGVTTPTALYDNFTLPGQLVNNTAPGLSLFSPPRYPNDIANLGPSGGAYLQALQNGQYQSALQYASGLLPTNGLVTGGVQHNITTSPQALFANAGLSVVGKGMSGPLAGTSLAQTSYESTAGKAGKAVKAKAVKKEKKNGSCYSCGVRS